MMMPGPGLVTALPTVASAGAMQVIRPNQASANFLKAATDQTLNLFHLGTHMGIEGLVLGFELVDVLSFSESNKQGLTAKADLTDAMVKVFTAPIAFEMYTAALNLVNGKDDFKVRKAEFSRRFQISRYSGVIASTRQTARSLGRNTGRKMQLKDKGLSDG